MRGDRITSDDEILARHDPRGMHALLVGAICAVAASALVHLYDTSGSDLRGRMTWMVVPTAALWYGGASGLAFAIASDRIRSRPDALRIVVAAAVAAALSLGSLVATFASGTYVDGTPIPASTGFLEFLSDLAEASHLRGATTVGAPMPPRAGGAWSFVLDAAVAAALAAVLTWSATWSATFRPPQERQEPPAA